MAAFNYTGMAQITWACGKVTEKFIDYAADTGTLRVYPEDEKIQDSEYLGTMRDHPAKHIKFLPNYYRE